MNSEYRTFKISSGFRDKGIDTKVWLINYKNTEAHYDNNIISPPSRKGNLLINRKVIASHLASFQPTHVWFTNGPVVALNAMMLYPKLVKLNLVYEVLDNYDTYYPKLLFPFAWVDRFLRKRALITLYVTSELMAKDGVAALNKKVFLNGYDPQIFKPMDKNRCREALSLPLTMSLVGYTGSLDQRVNDNIVKLATLFKSHNITIVIASNSPVPTWLSSFSNVIWLGKKKMEEVPTVINACDLMIIPNRQDAFTQYCFPSKLMEYIGCGVNFLITPINSLNNVVDKRNISSFDMNIFCSDVMLALSAAKPEYTSSKFTWNNLVGDLIKKMDG